MRCGSDHQVTPQLIYFAAAPGQDLSIIIFFFFACQTQRISLTRFQYAPIACTNRAGKWSLRTLLTPTIYRNEHSSGPIPILIRLPVSEIR